MVMKVHIIRIECRKCGMRVKNTFGEKLTHVLQYHSDAAIEELLTVGSIENKAREIGKHLGERFRHIAFGSKSS